MDRSETGVVTWSKADFLGLDLDAAPPGGQAAWLADRLRAAVADGTLPVGTRLPATRELAAELCVSRGLVTEAYRRLAEGGQVEGRGRAGTVVVQAPAPTTTPPPRQTVPMSFADPDLSVFDALRSATAPIDLTPGRPDLAGFPRTAWLRAERHVLDTVDPSAFGYADPAGVPVFREAISAWLARYRGIAVTPAEVVVVAGVAQALALLARVLPTTGVTSMAVEDPGSFGARRHLEVWGLRTVPVPVDERGLDVAALARTDARAVLLTPAHQFPAGVVLDGARRRELADWAAAGGLVVEDDYDAEHRYDRPPVAALRAALPDHVCYAGSLSKVLAPALRVGWLVVPPRLHRAVVEAKRDTDLGNASLPQLTLARLMQSGDLERHLRSVRARHRRRRDAMVAALARELPHVTVHGAAAGLHLTITYDATPGHDVELAAAALEAGVKVQPLAWHRVAPGRPGLVLGYAATSPADIERGVEALGGLLGRLLR